jgi:YbbR domain-containing protein
MTLRRFVFHHFWLKLFSVASGIVIWMAVHWSIEHDLSFTEPPANQDLAKRTILVPVTAVKRPDDNRVFTITPDSVMLTVIGERSVVDGPDRKDIKILVDLTDFRSRTNFQMDVLPDVPHGVDVTDVKPRTVSVAPSNP